MSASHAEQLAPGVRTWRLLVLTALLDGHGIPGSVLTAPATCQYLAGEDAARPPDPQQAWSALLALERAGLVAVDAASVPPAVWVSPALQTAVRVVAPPELLDRAARAAADALMQAWPQHQPRSWLAAALRSCAVSLRRAAGDALWAGGCPPLLLATGQSLEAAGQASPALAWWRELAADSERLLGPAHPDTLAAGGRLAAALLAAGQADQAVTWYVWLHSSRASMLGPDHPATIAAQVSLGRALSAAGQPGQALAALEEAAARSERACGPGDAGTVAAREEHAAALLAAGKTAEAIRLYKRLLADRERLHRPGHPGTVAVRLRLAEALLAAGKAKDAIAQHKTVLAGREQALGPDHPDTLAARAALAAACDAAGQMGAALAAPPGGVRRVRAGLRRRSPRHPGLPRGPGPRLRRRGPGRGGRDPAPRHHRPQRAGPVPRRPADPGAAAGPGRDHRGDDRLVTAAEGKTVTEFDYIIVGAGTAGCVLAARLTQDPGTRVLLLEAGGAERTRAMTVPDAWPDLLGTAADWADVTSAQADAGPVPYPRGRALGGSGAINAMAHIRGHRAVYDGWAAGGAPGWGFADLLPYFRRSESRRGPRPGAPRHLRPGPGRRGPRTGPAPRCGRVRLGSPPARLPGQR